MDYGWKLENNNSESAGRKGKNLREKVQSTYALILLIYYYYSYSVSWDRVQY